MNALREQLREVNAYCSKGVRGVRNRVEGILNGCEILLRDRDNEASSVGNASESEPTENGKASDSVVGREKLS